ncbi:MAG TPA: NlpC/P60 family protein [Micromonosporaceae bacterium]
MAATPATHAHAAPSAADLQARLDQEWNQLEPVIEQYDALHDALAANQARARQLEERIRPLALQVDVVRTQITAISVQMYTDGPVSALNALLTSGSPDIFADRLTLLDQVARDQRDQIASAVRLKARYDEQKRPLDTLIAEQARQQADLTAKKQRIEAEITRLQALARQAYGTTPGSLRLGACPSGTTVDRGFTAARWACRQIGKRYVYATAGPNTFDCSGLTMAAWASVGVALPHNAYQQSRVVTAITRTQLRPGDLVFYYSDVHHVGMYVGGGLIVHAPNSNDVVRMARLDIAPIAGYGRPG